MRSWLSCDDTCPWGPTCQTPSELSKLLLNTYKRPPRCPWPWPPCGLWIDWRLAQALQTADGGTWLPRPPELSARVRVGGVRKRGEGTRETTHGKTGNHQRGREDGALRFIFSSCRCGQRQGGPGMVQVGFWVCSSPLFCLNTRKVPSILER